MDELYAQLEALFGQISLNDKNCAVTDNIEELDKNVNEGLQEKIQPQIEK